MKVGVLLGFTDFFDRPLYSGDLVASKPGGRDACMRKGILLETGSVYFKSGGTGGSDIVKADTSLNEELKELQLSIISQRDDEEADRKALNKKNQENRIKKKDIKRFCVYDGEMFLGDCEIRGVLNKNVWVRYRTYHSHPSTSKNTPLLDIYSKYYGSNKLFIRTKSIRTCFYPKKMKLEAEFTREEVNELLNIWYVLPSNVFNYASSTQGYLVPV